jgi:bifunctional UDP-N-acetylglucosamine pyrophosphorylase/glucosamine-1-phosphate N-acetyltransferase
VEERYLVAIVLAGGKGTRMKSDLPKVLHDLSGRSVIRHAVANLREASIGDVIVVVGHRRDQVTEHLDGEVRFAVQEHQLGTGHAVQQALSLVGETSESVFVCYGDMPFLSTSTIRRLIDTRSHLGVAGVILTMIADNPPDYGRVIRDENGRVKKVVEVKDCTAEELKIREVNVGVYCFDAGALRWSLPRLDDDNAQGEYQLTDVVRVLAGGGRRVETMRTDSLEEAHGINDRADLERAQRLNDIRSL